MEELIRRTGGDGETHGIIGRIYKDRYGRRKDPADLDKAIDHYRAGFEKEPSDYYPGVNLVNLLLVYGGDQGRREVAKLVPRVREALAARMDPERSDYWELATAMHLAAVAREWDQSGAFVDKILKQLPDRWMLESTISELVPLGKSLSEPERSHLDALIAKLIAAPATSEARNA